MFIAAMVNGCCIQQDFLRSLMNCMSSIPSAPSFTGQVCSMGVDSPAFPGYTCVSAKWVLTGFPCHIVRHMTWLKTRLVGCACANMLETCSKLQASQLEEWTRYNYTLTTTHIKDVSPPLSFRNLCYMSHF